MDPDLTELSSFLADAGTDGYLFVTDDPDADQYYVSGFSAPDGVVSLYAPDADGGSLYVLTNELEYGRAESESHADGVVVGSDLGYRELRREYDDDEARHRLLGRFLDEHGVEAASVPANFPLGTGDALRELGYELLPEDDGVIEGIRAVKTDEEVERIRTVQAANEAAMAAVERLLAGATLEDGRDPATEAGEPLYLDEEVLTSERVKEEIEVTLLGERCGLDEAIVACGTEGAEPHNRGSGPLRSGEPIVVDIFPRSKATKYHGDMTRTFVVGQPDERAREFYDLTREAFEAALAAVEPGATGAEVHAAACEVYEDAGFPTLRNDPGTETGYIHSTGHGVGLEVHEGPSVGEHADEPLEPGHVVTIEPGLYDPEVGGVRIEDLVVVREPGEGTDGGERGYENLTDYPIEFVV